MKLKIEQISRKATINEEMTKSNGGGPALSGTIQIANIHFACHANEKTGFHNTYVTMTVMWVG